MEDSWAQLLLAGFTPNVVLDGLEVVRGHILEVGHAARLERTFKDYLMQQFIVEQRC
jgi:hypothetical protein